MNNPSRTSSLLRVSGLSVLLTAIAALAYGGLRWGRSGPRLDTRHPGGFRDRAFASGIDFRMEFLPQEQGENFKVNLYDHGCGVAVADYDGDGDEDLLLLNQLGANALYRNRGDGTFDNVTAESGPLALDDRICVGAAFGDYDNDDDQDLYITSTRGGNTLWRNQGGGRFQDVTAEAGVASVAHAQTPAFFDYDNDGDLDLFVTNTAKWTADTLDSRENYYLGPKSLREYVSEPDDLEPNVLFRNDGDGTFTIATREAGLEGQGWSGDVAVFDYDDDGDLDIAVTNMFGQSQLYANDGEGHFADVTRQTLRRTSYGAIGCKAFDYNNDGRLDLFIADMHSDMWVGEDEPFLVIPGKKYRNRAGPKGEVRHQAPGRDKMPSDRLAPDERLVFGNTLFRNDGQGRFSEVSEEANMETFWPWGVAIGDFDNDGWEDVYLPSGMGYPYFYWPSALMMNRGDGGFEDRAGDEGIEPPLGGRELPERIAGRPAVRSSRCAAVADFDGDGRLELVVNNFNDRPYYFRNQFPHRHYIAFRLRGVKSNHDAIGAVVKLYRNGEVMTRQVHCTGGYLSQSSKRIHFGLGDTDSVERVEIRWPSGVRQVLDHPAADRLHEVVEIASAS